MSVKKLKSLPPMVLKSLPETSTNSVSYTHLDVYKRQVPAELARLPTSVSLAEVNGELRLTVAPLTLR